MGDISTWSPTDNSNTAAPPDGWPESMAPSAVNNSARAMMGAIRRWYDWVLPQLASITSYMPLAGGTMTGNLTAPYIHSTGDLDVSGSVTGNYLHSLGNVLADGTVTGTAFIGNVSVPANGPVSTGGTVTGGQLTSTGNISATSGTVSAANVTTSSNVTAAGSVTGGSMHSTGTMQVDGQCNFLQTVNIGPSGGYARIDGVGTYNVSGSWLTFSDRAVKQEATIAPYERGLEAIMALRPCAYRYRPELFGAEEAERVRYGLVADEVAPIVPEMVGEAVFGGRHLSTLAVGHLPLVLLNACRELAAQNTALAARITALEGNHAI